MQWLWNVLLSGSQDTVHKTRGSQKRRTDSQALEHTAVCEHVDNEDEHEDDEAQAVNGSSQQQVIQPRVGGGGGGRRRHVVGSLGSGGVAAAGTCK